MVLCQVNLLSHPFIESKYNKKYLHPPIKNLILVSLCRAGCGVSTSRDGVKFEFDEDEDVSNNKQHGDTQSVDAVSRIGATSIGEVSLSVASHLGVSSSNAPSASVRESTTALAGSING